MAWQIEFHPATEKELKGLDPLSRRRILRFLSERVSEADDPRSIGEPLRGPELGRFWKYRVGPYRVICDIQDERVVVLVVRIGHRREVCR